MIRNHFPSLARFALSAALVAAVPFWAIAQDAAKPAEGTPAEAPPASGEQPSATAASGEAAANEKPAAPVKARPAEIMPLAAKSLVLDVARTDSQLVAVGDRGDILTSPDGGEWTQQPVPVRAAMTAVAFADAQNGWAVGHDAAIVHTADGGKTWTLQNFEPALEKPFMDVLFLDVQHGFAVGAYGLLRETTDGGASWKDVEAPAIRGDELHFNGIAKLGNGDLFIAGESGMLGLSSDQGKTWKKMPAPYDSTLFGVLPSGPKGALIYGLRGNVYLSQDVRAGKWQKVATGTVASMFGGAVLPDGRFALVGLNGVVLLVDASGSVKLLQTAAGTPLSGALALDDKTLLVVGESGIQTVKLQ